MDGKRFMTIEDLGVLHVAAMAPEGVEPCLIDAARAAVETGDLDGLEFGSTFADTLALNSSRIDVFIP